MPPRLLQIRLVAMLLVLAAPAAVAEPMHLDDPKPRWVAVRFEVSRADRPGTTDTVYSPAYPAWFAMAPDRDTVRVSVSGQAVEQLLQNQDPLAGSFSDFVWEFDTRTGHVLSARFSGTLRLTLKLGPARWGVESDVHAQLSTHTVGGFEPPHQVLGLEVNPFCEDSAANCTPMSARPYAPESGYVHAIGPVVASAGLTKVRSYCPLGEAVFTELGADDETVLATGTPIESLSRSISSPPPLD
jgi:hypothetical protein